MRAAVERAFVPFTGRLEGVVPWLYQDILGLVTVAIGNLVDPMSYALSLPFVHPDGREAAREDIASQWQAVKNDPKAAKLGHRYAERLTSIRLTPAGVETVVRAKLRQNQAALLARLPEFNDWPADAQLALHSWAWACGTGGKWPRLMAALRAKDFATAAVEIHINENGPDGIPNTPDDNWGLKPRNVANKAMLRNAAEAMSSGGMFDFEELRYPVAGLRPEDTAKPSLPITPSGHAPPRQSAVLPEEVTGSGGIVHPFSYDWPSYRG